MRLRTHGPDAFQPHEWRDTVCLISDNNSEMLTTKNAFDVNSACSLWRVISAVVWRHCQLRGNCMQKSVSIVPRLPMVPLPSVLLHSDLGAAYELLRSAPIKDLSTFQ